MKITAVSDLHGNLITIEPCDVLLICGDISPLEIQKDYIQMTKWIFNEFMDWINQLPCDKVFLTPGNHDFWFEKFCNTNMINVFKYGKLEILINESRKYFCKGATDEVEGITIYGTPACKRCGPWAYMYDTEELEEIYSKIPEDVDILMTHEASDFAEIGVTHLDGDIKIPYHCYALTNAIKEKKPKYALCGHIHSGNHNLTAVPIFNEIDGSNSLVRVANCSILDESYSVYYRPLTFEI